MTQPSLPARRETYVLAGVLAAAVGWAFVPFIAQPQSYHAFADQRAWLGIPHAADVLSNLAFVIAGLLGWRWLSRAAVPRPAVVHLSLRVFFAGLVLTGVGSAWYHWSPSDLRLSADRLPMTIAFAGVFGAMFAERVSPRSGRALLVLMLLAGPASVLYWVLRGDLSLYAIVQFGGVLALLALLVLVRPPAGGLPWAALLAWYVLAKLAEAADLAVWTATGGVFAGHALKHLAAAAGGLAIARALRAPGTDGVQRPG